MPQVNHHSFLPKALLCDLAASTSLSTSRILTREFEEFRVKATKRTKNRETSIEAPVVLYNGKSKALPSTGSVDAYDRIERNREDFSSDAKKTFLHFAVSERDLPLAYEIIRMGIILDFKDSEGVTPLFLAMGYLHALEQVLQTVSKPGFMKTVAPANRAGLEPEYVKQQIFVVTRIATLIIEQHGDVNASAFGKSVLSLAVEGSQWDLVELLLRHGARRLPASTFTYAVIGDKRRYVSALDRVKACKPRLERPCPCWSGKLLSQCHNRGEPVPYADDHLCGCGRRKTYGTCCGKKGIEVVEAWDEGDKWIMPTEIRKFPMNGPRHLDPSIREHFAAGMQRQHEVMQKTSPDMMKEVSKVLEKNKGDWIMKMLKLIERDEYMDPAFHFALNNTDFFPRPWVNVLSRVEGNTRMKEWNDQVDKFIANDMDPLHRPRREIEIEAKIGGHGGPLYRRCENEDCEKIELIDVEKLQQCGGCKLIFYCSKECQVAGWPSHKSVCRSGAHTAQLLDSQWAMEQVMGCMTAAAGMRA
ncbi:hypothetical protein CYLTODRAFT_446995 [Cylindrobasidium torrendii FP15055 ss-10]|uniref:MYND-type domain-containing protein n=1 Tax=Cylindrobasidium torrendii FP15055 ss-10 TaxID=1314674 RepID=A0A0D7AWR1_9AGAR|nr:hypothetical protein CYLTODRAFT_446995 [Cylindrobasidium torrendii FP15055 ss-10]